MKRIKRAACGTVAVFGVFIAFTGLVLCMCETPGFMDQLRNMLAGIVVLVVGSAMAYIGGSVRWREGPYAGL